MLLSRIYNKLNKVLISPLLYIYPAFRSGISMDNQDSSQQNNQQPPIAPAQDNQPAPAAPSGQGVDSANWDSQPLPNKHPASRMSRSLRLIRPAMERALGPDISPKLIVVSLIIVAIIGVSLYLIAVKGIFAISTTTTFSTTIVPGNINSFSGCTAISKSGTYYLSKSAKIAMTQGACVNITASNVDIICNNNQRFVSPTLCRRAAIQLCGDDKQ